MSLTDRQTDGQTTLFLELLHDWKDPGDINDLDLINSNDRKEVKKREEKEIEMQKQLGARRKEVKQMEIMFQEKGKLRKKITDFLLVLYLIVKMFPSQNDLLNSTNLVLHKLA